jgi:heavy-metal resistance protein
MLSANRGKAFLMLLLAALFGAAVSAIVLRAGGPGHRPGFRGPEGYVRLLDRELDLTPAQEDSVRAILGRFSPGMDSLWRSMRPRIDSLRSQVRSAVRAQLTPGQQERYTRLTERLDSERRQRDTSSHRE